MSQFSFIFTYVKKHKGQFFAGMVILFVVDFVNLLIPKITGTIIDGLTSRTMDTQGVQRQIFFILAVGAVLAIGRFLRRYFFFGTSRSIERELRDGMFEHLETMSVEYYGKIMKRGVSLSGGQKQCSSIARALMKDAPILILDDALSAVDMDTEEHILKNLKENRAGKTTILIAHRISTIQSADRILVLEDGEAEKCGTHQELMELHGIYRDMFEKQQLEAAKGEKRAALEAL